MAEVESQYMNHNKDMGYEVNNINKDGDCNDERNNSIVDYRKQSLHILLFLKNTVNLIYTILCRLLHLVPCIKQGVFDLTEVQYAMVETSAHLSIIKKSANQPTTSSDYGINLSDPALPAQLIMDGKIIEQNRYNEKHHRYFPRNLRSD